MVAGLKQHLSTVVVAVVVAVLGAGGSIFLLGATSAKPASAQAAAVVHDQKNAKRGHIAPLSGTHTTKPSVRKVVPVERATSAEHRSLLTVQTTSFYDAARRVVAAHWGSSSLTGAHVSLSVACKNNYAVVIWSAPSRLASIEVWLRQAGSAWQALSGSYTHYGSSGQAVASSSIPGSRKPSNAICFQ